MPTTRSATELGAAIRAARVAVGWTQAELAAQAGVGRQWLVSVERGHPRGEVGMVLSVLDQLGLVASVRAGIDRPVRRRRWITAGEAANAIREELGRNDDDFALRLVARALADFRSLTEPAARAEFLAEPPSTGDRRWDTLLAATVGRECRLADLAAPPWTQPVPLRTWWFPVPDRLLVARTMQRTPVDLSIRGIWLDGRALQSV